MAAPELFDLFDPDWANDPQPLYAQLRAEAPVYRTALGFQVVARHEDCLTVLRHRAASVDAANIAPEHRPVGFRPVIDLDDPVVMAMREARPFLFHDAPSHTRLRGLVAKAFTPKVVEGLRARTQAIVDELLDGILGAGEVDLLQEFAYPLPVRVICELLGVPLADEHLFRGWSHALARGLDPDFLLTDEIIEERIKAIGQFSQYFFALLAERRAHPGDDLLSLLVQVEDGGTTLSEAEMLSTCILLLVAGHETTVNLISGGTKALLEHPDQLVRFRDDPGLGRTAVDELLRFVSPVQLTGRTLLEPLALGDAEIEQGEFVMLLLASGNHDPEVFERPEELDVGRTPNNHLGFGFGAHHCLGAPLARMETQVALTSLVQRAPDLALAGGPLVYKTNVVLRGLEALPVTT